MKLKKATIHKYKSFMTEQSFNVEDKTTRIVGKNESGKSAILEALAKSNYFEEDTEFKFDKNLDYPRRDLIKIKDEFPEAITCQYELEPSEVQQIEEKFCKGILVSHIFSVTTKYNSGKIIDGLRINLNLYKEWLIKEYKIGEEGRALILNCTDFSSLRKVIAETKSIPGFDLIQKHFNELMPDENKWDNSVCYYIYHSMIAPKIPKTWYFNEYYSMPSRVDIEDMVKWSKDAKISKDEHKILCALFDLSGLSLEDIQNEDNFERFKAKLESTSNAIKSDMFDYWSTNNNLEIRFDIEHPSDGKKYLNIRIYNSNHRATLPLKNRSKGFLWFFSFLVWFSRIENDKNDTYIILLDEPGLNLHAAAQADLLRFIDEKLSSKYQVIYTTHSPFMIDSSKLHEVRTVYDNQDPKFGSVISDALEEKDSDTLFPLQAALGYSIAQNLYVSKKNLLVEGISDLSFLSYFSSILHSEGKEGLNDDITIVPVGGADKISTFISLMRGNNLSLVCLLDKFINSSARDRLNNLTDEKIIKPKNIIYYSDFGEDINDIEDMFTTQEYLILFNGAFGTNITQDDIINDKPILPQLNKIIGKKRFTHYLPANYLVRNSAIITFSDATFARFEKLFTKINHLLR